MGSEERLRSKVWAARAAMDRAMPMEGFAEVVAELSGRFPALGSLTVGEMAAVLDVVAVLIQERDAALAKAAEEAGMCLVALEGYESLARAVLDKAGVRYAVDSDGSPSVPKSRVVAALERLSRTEGGRP